MEEKPFFVKTYKKVWKLEKFIYSLDKFKLPRPVTLWQVLYFIIGLIAVTIISQNTPLLNRVPVFVKFLLIPGGLSFYLSKVKHDGKKPHAWLVSQIRYWLSPKYLCRYQTAEKPSRMKYVGFLGYRAHYSINKDK